MDFLFRLGAVFALVFSLSLKAETIIQDASEAWAEGIRFKAEADSSFAQGKFKEAKSSAEKAIRSFQFLRAEYPSWRTRLVQVNKTQLEEMMVRFDYFSNLKLEGMSKEELVKKVLSLKEAYSKQLVENQKLLSLYAESSEVLGKVNFSQVSYRQLEKDLAKVTKELKATKKILVRQSSSSELEQESKEDEVYLKVLRNKKKTFFQENESGDEEEKLNEKIKSLNLTLYGVRANLFKAEKTISQLEKKILKLNERNSALKTDLNSTRDLVSLSKLKRNSNEERKTLLSKIIELQESETRLNISNSALRKNLADFRRRVKGADKVEAELASLKRDYEKSSLTFNSLRKDLKRERAKVESLTKALSLETNKTNIKQVFEGLSRVQVQKAMLEDMQEEVLTLKEELSKGQGLAKGSHVSANDIETLKNFIQEKDRVGFKQKLELLLGLYENDYQLWYLKAFEAYSYKNFNQAYRDVEKAYDLKKHNISVLELYGKLSLLMKDNHLALSLYSKLLSIDDTNFAYHQSLALVMKALGFRDAAEKSLLKAHELNKSSKLVVYNLCVFLIKDKNKKADAHKWYKKYLELGGKKVSQLEAFFDGKDK